MKNFLYTLIISVTLFGCTDNDDKIKYPECIKSGIETFLANYPTPPNTGYKASVAKYSYNGEIVYVTDFSPGFPDGSSAVVNEKCEVICGLGGIDGNNNDCIDWSKATFIETVWKDSRK
jgi:hypothetical protein